MSSAVAEPRNTEGATRLGGGVVLSAPAAVDAESPGSSGFTVECVRLQVAEIPAILWTWPSDDNQRNWVGRRPIATHMAHTNDVGAELSRLRQLQAEQDEQWHQLKRRLESVDPAIRFAIGELPTTNATAAAVIPNGVRV